VPQKKSDIIRIDLDSLGKTPLIGLGRAADYFLELVSENIIEHLTVTSHNGKTIYQSDINGNKFVFAYHAACRDMFLLEIKLEKQKTGLQILVL